MAKGIFKKNVKKLEDSCIWAFIDGSSLGNPGPGGWGSIIRYPNDFIKELGGFSKHTTNNKMELQAAIQAINLVNQSDKLSSSLTLQVVSDSLYLIEGITQWIHRWKKTEWKTSQGSDVQNAEEWGQLDAAVDSRLRSRRNCG